MRFGDKFATQGLYLDSSALFRVGLATVLALHVFQLLQLEFALFPIPPQILGIPLHSFLILHILILAFVFFGIHWVFQFLNYFFVCMLIGYFLPSQGLKYASDPFLIFSSLILVAM